MNFVGPDSSFEIIRKLSQEYYDVTWALTNDQETYVELFDERLRSQGSSLNELLAHEDVAGSGHGFLVPIHVMAKWPVYGFPHVIMGPKRAASFALTSVSDASSVEHLKFPWDVFYVTLPTGLLKMEGGTDYIDRIAVRIYEWLGSESLTHRTGDRVIDWMASSKTTYRCMFKTGMCAHDFIDSSMLESSMEAEGKRVASCIDKIILGIAQYFENPDLREKAKKRATGKTARKKHKRYPKGITNYIPTEDVLSDAGTVLREYLEKGGKSPVFRSYVRPHWHTFWVGPGRKERRLNYIDGYMKGPKGGPIRLKNQRVPEKTIKDRSRS